MTKTFVPSLSLFVKLHNHRKRTDHQRLGQRFCNMYIKERWPELFYEREFEKARELIRNWLMENHYINDLPQVEALETRVQDLRAHFGK